MIASTIILIIAYSDRTMFIQDVRKYVCENIPSFSIFFNTCETTPIKFEIDVYKKKIMKSSKIGFCDASQNMTEDEALRCEKILHKEQFYNKTISSKYLNTEATTKIKINNNSFTRKEKNTDLHHETEDNKILYNESKNNTGSKVS